MNTNFSSFYFNSTRLVHYSGTYYPGIPQPSCFYFSVRGRLLAFVRFFRADLVRSRNFRPQRSDHSESGLENCVTWFRFPPPDWPGIKTAFGRKHRKDFQRKFENSERLILGEMNQPPGDPPVEPQGDPEGLTANCIISHAEGKLLYLQKVDDMDNLQKLR